MTLFAEKYKTVLATYSQRTTKSLLRHPPQMYYLQSAALYLF